MIPQHSDRRTLMLVREAMSDDVRIANPNQTIREAATLMAKIDAGILPVGDNDRLVGMISDRDIAVRAIALGKGPDTPVREVMSAGRQILLRGRRRRRRRAEHGRHQGSPPAGAQQEQASGRHRLARRSRADRRPRPTLAKRSAASPSRVARIRRRPIKRPRGRAEAPLVGWTEAARWLLAAAARGQDC